MVDSLDKSQNYPFEAWNKFIQTTLKTSSSVQPMPLPILDGSKFVDPWLSMINQAWKTNPYKKFLSLEPAEFTEAFQQLWTDTMANAFNTMNNYSHFMQQYAELMTTETMKFWGNRNKLEAVAQPEKGDKRFNAPEWDEYAVFDSLKQFYLLTATTLLKTTSEARGLDEKQQHKLIFYIRQFLDAISPTNFTFTNPLVIEETVKSGGQNLVAGMQHLLRDIKAGQIKMTDTEAFAPGRNLAITPGQVVYRNTLIELIQYTPTTAKVHEFPILFLPHWINRYYILDLQAHNSLIKFLVDQGFTVFVISWKNPDASCADITFDDYLTMGSLKALEIVKDITGSKKVNTVGYCIGGSLLAMTLPYLEAKHDDTVNSGTFFVSMQDFSDVGETSVFIDEPQVALMDGQMQSQGFLDSRQMANMFNLLRDNDLIWSNVVNNYLLGKEPPAFDLLYWNADGTRMAPKAHSYYLHNIYLENNLIKPGKIVLNGVPIDLNTIKQDVYSVGTEQDHLVPWKSAWRITKLIKGKVRFILGGSGHIAGIINPLPKDGGTGQMINPFQLLKIGLKEQKHIRVVGGQIGWSG